MLEMLFNIYKTNWEMSWNLVTEYWYVYLILTIVMAFVVFKYEKQIHTKAVEGLDWFRGLIAK